MNKKALTKLLFQMKRIRHVEQEIARNYDLGLMRCPTHLSVGQEGVASGVGFALKKQDLAVSGHRAHAHYLAKGGCLNRMIAEIYGKVTGCSKGKGGSMHLIDESVGFMGSTAIVGGTVPIGVGLAYGIKQKKSKQISCIFLGDAVLETGVFFESINFAVLKNLPVLFVCENNLYSVYSPLKVRQPKNRNVNKILTGMGIKSYSGNGNNIEEVYNLTKKAVDQIRNGKGPFFIEYSTYRWLEHCGPNYDNEIGYRSVSEFEKWKESDPILNFEDRLLQSNIVTTSEIKKLESKIFLEVEKAFAYAASSPFPDPKEAFTNLYQQSNYN
jgi:pyruvate dehydrogenase E1 component alpha subunit